ncbi:biotin--[acetyl-CoA-carboxylase] ligase [Campylobacter upsaliensis]|uniref:Biotin-acetyl-CoA-carboxylase ligase n=1 Tax=Campylobacter upsaliensis JV21 TaxID=888826 RepID=A0A828QUK0_CAMUP|nr:biotin--[acetyl-CoA-carboxylase] ligase [Campylobacter upsaliensis]EAB5281578.1 biotin--[acetyl-CoA-carboxylase] ligase [Campylobacter upsaliensis]EAH4719901.1 biotin--[acetyl-CoA-carboxylase] ligase [Campylobacter upsaliensis]EAH5552859.1 biotin--[acetyl-CoA-carboxylase] ligase [Campylobacter upsaliensis]EAH5903671.1 biotin--[acetyl-CoA-carboxylase] ligase [Campylobacter upsaliensis]EAH6228339.1 biotin--[acetyl-CoA-carboxylase] ligase [Campylobacter upsaliensis]
MQIVCIEKIASTQLFLCEQIRKDEIKQNTAIYALEQTSGVGSRDNAWISSRGNLHLSFCVREEDLPSDLPLASVSIYFAYLLKDLLAQKGSQIWLKWSNDLYLNDKKVGGVMSHKIGEFVVCGMGLNLKFAPQNATFCDVEIEIKELVEEFIKVLEKKFLWKQIFSKYVLEFEKSKKFSVHYEGKLYALKDALLYEDGSILLANKRVYSLR